MRKVERKARKAMKGAEAPRSLYNVLAVFLGEEDGNLQLGYPPETDDFYYYLCGCDGLEYLPQQMVHFTEVICRKAKVAFCVYKDDYGELQLRKHPIGQCPDGIYKRSCE